jgi:methyl-accepting chemotaxis protein
MAKLWQTINKLSIKTKAIALAAIVGTLPVIACGSLAYYVTKNNLEKTEIENQQFSIGNLSSELSRFLSLRLKDTIILANQPLFNSKLFAENSNAERQKFLSQYLRLHEYYDSAVLFDLNGNSIVQDVVQNSQNKIVNYKSRPYFQEVLKTQQPVITNPKISKSTGAFVIDIATPVKSFETGQMIGVMRLRLPVKSLANILEKYGNNNNEWHLIDLTTGKFMLSQEEKHILRDVKTDFPGLGQLEKSRKVRSVFTKDKTHDNFQLLSYVTLDNQGELPDLDVGVAISRDLQLIQAKNNEVLIIIVIGSIVAGILTVTLSILLTDRASRFIRQLAENILAFSDEIVTTLEQQEESVNLQTNSVITTTSTVNELGSESLLTVERAEASANGALQALTLAEEGTRAVQQTMQGMIELRERVDAIAQQIVNLSEQTGEIATVSDLVADLANQTNMLALNAAVEAARAGENGRGFSVVAAEIRKLADQSRQSAEQINTLATEVQIAINRTVMVTDQGTKTVNEGLHLAEATANSFIGVTDAVNNVFLNSQQMSMTTKQQAIAIQKVLNAMNFINEGSKENTVGIHQVKMSTRELNQVADELKAVVV